MRKFLISFSFCFLFIIFLLQPETVVSGASEGLLLWFHTVLPTLFPFFVVTSLLTGTNAFSYISSAISPLFCRFFHISAPSVIAIIGGFFCGYPMGAKIVADLWKTNQISQAEGLYLLSFCNNASPMFIISFFITQQLKMPELAIPSIMIIFTSPILCSFIFRRYYFSQAINSMYSESLQRSPHSTFNFLELFDDAINAGMETILKIGGYIIFFSILISMLQQIPFKNPLVNFFLIPSLEITNSITLLANTSLNFWAKYVLMMSHISFGGLCAVFQTKCVLKKQEFPLGTYIIEKLVTAMATSLFSYIFLILSKFSF